MTGVSRNVRFPLLTLFLVFVTLDSVLADSFYGTSYIHLPLSQDLSASNIRLRFRTSRTKGLLVYASSSENLVLIRLKDAKLETVVRLGQFKLTLQSRKRPKLNNLRWHDLQMTFSDGQVVLYIDGEAKVSGDVPQDSVSLQDVYVGGTGSLESEHLSGTDKFFRGCLEDVTVGNINVLSAAKTLENAVYHDITQDCSVEFEAGIDDPVSFLKETSFILFPKWQIQDEGSFECWIRTSAPQGLLMFSFRGNTFIAAEIDGGHVRVLMKQSSNSETISVRSQRIVNDRKWHFVAIHLSSSFIKISVDLNPEQFDLSNPLEDRFEFMGTLYVGGVIHRARALAFSADLKSITHASTGGSLQGCVRDIELNGEQYALGDSLATHGIQVGCLYEFPCADDPCEPDQNCTETGPNSFECVCTGEDCQLSTSTEHTPTTFATSMLPSTTVPLAQTTETPTTPRFTLITVNPLSVMEGGGGQITSTNIHLNIDLRQYKLRQSQVLFKIALPPEFGRIEKDVLRRGNPKVLFTFLDLQTGKISYVHDGSENFEDQVVFVMSFSGRRNGIPIPNFEENMNFTVPIRITPVNDGPEVVISDDDTFRVIKNRKRVLPSSFLHAYDPDTPPEDVVIAIVSQQGNVGYFEHSSQPGKRLSSFTQEDINRRNISYVHTGPSTKSRIVLRASDGVEKSRLESFRIEAAQLEMEVANLTRLRTNPTAARVITPANLKMVTNDPEDFFEVSYLVTTPPRYGEVQRRESTGTWISTATFTHTDIQDGAVRYIASHATQKTYDQVGLSASSGTARKSGIFLPVEIVITSVKVVNNTGLVLNVVSKGFLSTQNLSSEATNVLDNSPISYQIVRAPVNGYIMKHLVGELTQGQNFTQDDVNDGLISYNLNGESYKSFNDTLLFRVVVSSTQSEVQELIVTYFPDSEQIGVTNNGFTVEEGGTFILSPADLFLRTSASSDFSYSVTSSPVNGLLQLIDPSTGQVVNSNVTSFLNLDISNGAFRYKHDDSETTLDTFGIAGTSSFLDRNGHPKEATFKGVVNVTVELLNDNSPVRVVDKVFKVIKNGLTVLTTEDIMFTDADSDFDDDDLLYQRQRVNIGDFVSTNDPSESVFNFKQRDIRAGKITFKHRGNRENARMLILVYDKGKRHFVAKFLEIQALESFVNVSMNTGIVVGKGETNLITNANLSSDTNMNVKPRNIGYMITSGPLYGSIMAEGVSIQQFTQASLDSGAVSYQHDNISDSHSDDFNFTVHAKGLEAQGQFSIRVLIASQEELPEIEKLQPIVGESGKEVILNKFNLKISHPNNIASEIVYTVTSPPKYGELRLKNEYGIIISRSPPVLGQIPRKRRQSADTIMRFTQQDVSRGYVSYIQTDYSGLVDEFSFKVTNGYTTLSNLTMTVDIAPTIVPVAIHNFTVLEERSKTITSDIIKAGHSLYEPLDFTVHVVESPKHGIIENTRQPGVNLESFTTQDISNEFIYYVHDGSEWGMDSFKIALNNTDGKYSDVHTIYVTVLQVNDQPPVVTINRGLTAITGASTPVTNSSLSASDRDTPNSNLTFTITSPGNGFLAHKGREGLPVLFFTQADLTSGSLLFIHQGSKTGGFRFEVSDGVHTTQQQIFSIRAEPLLLELANNSKLMVTPGAIQPITTEHLGVVTNEDPVSDLSRPITYEITIQPASGKVVKILSKDGASDTISYEFTATFTQNDINDGNIAFKHDNSSSLQEDSFQFDVFLPLSQNLSGLVFQLSIPLALSTSTLPPVTMTTMMSSTPTPDTTTVREDSNGIINTGTEVLEGGTVTVSDDNLDATILLSGLLIGYVQYTLTKAPHHGYLAVSGRNITVGASFTQQELSSPGLRYHHDHSDTSKDSFNFTANVKLFGTALGNTVPTASGVFHFTVLPVNDQKLTVVTTSLTVSVVQGEHVTLNARYLNITDEDNPPSEISYRILTPPTNGILVNINDRGTNVKNFKQSDVNSNKLEFIHDGGSVPGVFVFRVDDGKHFQIKRFTIDVALRVLAVTSIKSVQLEQGDRSVVIMDHNLNISSNGNISTSIYNITRLPTHGEIRVNSLVSRTFTQHDIEQGLVTYFQTDISSAEDKLQLTLYDDFNVIPNINLTVNVDPLIELNSVSALSGDLAPITQLNLNTTQLASKTGSSPSFQVIDAPRFGRVLSVNTSETVLIFNSKDLNKQDIVYEAERLEIAENQTLTDNLTLLLVAEGAQPVTIMLQVVIGKGIPETTTHLLTMAGTTPMVVDDTLDNSIDEDPFPVDNDSGMTTKSLESRKPSKKAVVVEGPSLVVIIVVSIVIVLVVFIIILAIFVWRRWRGKKAIHDPVSEDELPETVGGAPVIITSMVPDTECDPGAVTQPMIKRPIQSPMLPQVKVTPLGRPPSPVNSYASLTSSGTFQSSAFTNNWSNIDQEMFNNLRIKNPAPTLKKSQYWV